LLRRMLVGTSDALIGRDDLDRADDRIVKSVQLLYDAGVSPKIIPLRGRLVWSKSRSFR
jgi:hypothetical protein